MKKFLILVLCAISCTATAAKLFVYSEAATLPTVYPQMQNTIQYPVFNVPLEGWSEIEVKASTNNFNPASTNSGALWFESLGSVAYTNWYNYIHADVNGTMYYCNPDNTNYNSRSWILKPNNVSLTECISTNGNYQTTVVYVPSISVKDGTTNYWMYPANQNLVWVYRRRTASYGETNALGHAIWHPIAPTEWRVNSPAVHF